MEISKLTLSELQRLKTRVEAEISRRTDTTKRDLLKKMQRMANDAGIALEELIDAPATTKKTRGPKAAVRKGAAAARTKGKVAAKYRHPEDASLEWTGRGRKPLWVSKWLSEGKPLEDLLISK